MANEPTVRVRIEAEISHTTRNEQPTDSARIVERSTASVKFREKYEGYEAAAEAMYLALYDQHALWYSIWDKEIVREEFGESVSKQSRDMMILGAYDYPPVLYLTARKRAAVLTQQSMTRRGYSVERVLAQMDDETAEGEMMDGLKGVGFAATRALLGLIDQTPGGEIDADAIPRDEYGDPDMDDEPGKRAMLPAETVEE